MTIHPRTQPISSVKIARHPFQEGCGLQSISAFLYGSFIEYLLEISFLNYDVTLQLLCRVHLQPMFVIL
jgi:hypothetical protein